MKKVHLNMCSIWQ